MRFQFGFPKWRIFSAVLSCLFLALAHVTLDADAIMPRIDLTGVIQSADAPIEGAHVFIYTAGPRVGPGDI